MTLARCTLVHGVHCYCKGHVMQGIRNAHNIQQVQVPCERHQNFFQHIPIISSFIFSCLTFICSGSLFR